MLCFQALCDHCSIRLRVRLRPACFLLLSGLFLATLTTVASAQTISTPPLTAAQLLAQAEQTLADSGSEAALPLLIEASDRGSAAAKRELGLLWLRGHAVQANAGHALQWFEAAAAGGDTRAFSYIGDFYLHAENGKPDPSTALYWYRKAEKAGDARGTIALSQLYCSGTGVKKDLDTCAHFLDAAGRMQNAEDHADVRVNLETDAAALGAVFQNGPAAGRSSSKAGKWYAQAATLGSVPSAVAESKLYIEPHGLRQNLPRAAAILDAAVKNSNFASDSRSRRSASSDKNAVAETYVEIAEKYTARGPRETAPAIPLYQKAAALGLPAPAIELGMRYAKGDRVPQSFDRSYQLLNGLVKLPGNSTDRPQLAAALGELATQYAHATGAKANPQRARELQQEAAEERRPIRVMEPPPPAMAEAMAPPPPPQAVERYPNMQAPDSVEVQQEFAVNVSLNTIQFDNNTQILSGQQENGKLQITLPAGMTSMPIQVDLIAPGMTFTDGSNTATLLLDKNQDNSTPAVFHVRAGAAPASDVLLATLSYHQIFLAQLERSIEIAAASDATTQNAAAQTTPAQPAAEQSATSATPMMRSASDTHLVTPTHPVAPAHPPIVGVGAPTARDKSNERPAPVVIDPTAQPADLTITETLVDDTMHYTFDSPALAGPVYAQVPMAAATKAKVAQDYTQLQAQSVVVESGSGPDCAADRAKGGGGDKDSNCTDSLNARATVEGIGNDLYDNLAPPEFRALYQLLTSRHIRLHTITVVTESPTLPWELMRPKAADGTREFLGLTAAIVRENMSAPQLAQPNLIPFDGIALVAPDYSGQLALNGSATEVKLLKSDFPEIHLVDGDASSVGALLRSAPQGIIHFTGHGQRIVPTATGAAAPAALQLAPQVAIALSDQSMTPDTFVAFLQEGQTSHPFYFFNACDIGRSDAELNYISGWAPALMQSGASGYLGALYQVGDASAVSFAANFYAGLKTDMQDNAAWTMAELVTDARRKTYAEDNDPTALAYVLYAKPYMKLVAEDR
jgi:TPR repeat protein